MPSAFGKLTTYLFIAMQVLISSLLKHLSIRNNKSLRCCNNQISLPNRVNPHKKTENDGKYWILNAMTKATM